MTGHDDPLDLDVSRTFSETLPVASNLHRPSQGPNAR